jgi:hypothetical protein
MQAPPERLGSFYLGSVYDLQRGAPTEVPVAYDARDLTTHAMCVGMTGSGKTGLCLSLLEEAAIDQVPAILIDPKGDIANLMLQFPDLSPDDFLPWVSQDDVRREGSSAAQVAAEVAGRWKEGLAAWGISPDRLRTLQESVDYTIYTPGSDAGVPINILGSLAAPGLDFDQHAESIRERIAGTVNALLGLVGIAADPVQSREAILLSAIFEYFWRNNQDLDLAKLILSLQNPPVRQLGVLDVDTFYPEKDRFALAMAFNNLLASPKFQSWLQGETLHIESLLYTADGKPRHSIFYIAHLSPDERMFFVTLLLESVLAWVFRQAGTRSLRALLYFDEVYGYLPPVAQPPSKRPLMGLLKQGRAAGLGCILATQNPADLDYKALTNTGTWFIGRLQAERDKMRLLEGLQNAIAESGGQGQRVDFDRLIGQLKPRLFLMHNVHEDQPVVMQTRWAMSYLHGPLTRRQIEDLMAPRRRTEGDEGPKMEDQAPSSFVLGPSSLGPPAGFSAQRQALDPAIPQFFLPLTIHETAAAQELFRTAGADIGLEPAQLVYQPAILGGGLVRLVDDKRRISEQRERVLLAPVPDALGGVAWDQAAEVSVPLGALEQQPARAAALPSIPHPPAPPSVPPSGGEAGGAGPFFGLAPEAANSPAELKSIARSFADWLYYHSQISLLAHPEFDVVQRPGESEQEFKGRLRQAARERRDAGVDDLRERYAARIEKVEAKLRRQQRELEQDEEDYGARKGEALIATGEMLFTVLTRRRLYRTASWTASRRRLAQQAKLDVAERRKEIEEMEAELSELQADLEREIAQITPKWVDLLKGLTNYTVRPKRSDIEVKVVGLAWVPAWAITYRAGGQTLTATLPAYQTQQQ